ncbi:hypothetical protein IJJ39_01590 [Candidatus Saccharibacteria bacterium]|nr:hypothetical protein [Candidatus Saccharibacteria bacterium]
MKYPYYFRASAKLILVVRDKIAYLEHASELMGDFERESFASFEDFRLGKDALQKVAFDDEDLVCVYTKSDEDANAMTLSKNGDRPYDVARVVNFSVIFASRSGRTLDTDVLAEVAEKFILGLGHTIGALYVEYRLGIDGETKVSLLSDSAATKFEATEEELMARKKKHFEEMLADLHGRL